MPLLGRRFPETPRPEPCAPLRPASESSSARAAEPQGYQELKARVHNALFEHVDLSRVGEVSSERAAGEIALITRRILDEERIPLTREEREQVVEEIQHEVFGLGPLEPLLRDPTLSDILVNRYDQVYVERGGRLEKAVTRFKDDAHLMRIIEKITSSVGRRIDELTPWVDARLPDGSRVNAIIPPVALDGPKLSIRRFSIERLTHRDLVRSGTLSEEAVEVLAAIARGRLNVLISGGTGSGKTTLLNVMSAFIPESERIVTIEDSAELQLQQEHVVRLETRPPNVEGRGAVTQRDLVVNTLRMRPDRILVGEVRGAEALDMLQAMNTGHDGSLTTVHANSPRDAVSRLEAMVAMSGVDLPQRVVRQQIGSAIDVIVHLVRLSDGSRRLESLVELTGMEGDVISISEIYRLERRGLDATGGVLATLEPTGIRPQFCERLALSGIELAELLFRRPGRRG
jgi:pilus assembly protein CpaF